MTIDAATQALLDLVEADREQKCAAILDEAKARASALLAQAHADARARMRDAFDEERERMAGRIAAAQAMLATKRRLAQQQRAAALLAAGWQRLPQALVDAWREPAARKAWVERVAAEARALLPGGTWRIVHAPDWPAAEREVFAAELSATPVDAGARRRSARARRPQDRSRRQRDRRHARRAARGPQRDRLAAAARARSQGDRNVTRATIRWISGPVLRAVAEGSFALREAVHVGPQALLGEVVRIDHDEIVVQVYEDTTGLRPGIAVTGSGLPLAIPLGPGLLGNIFDGLLRPLSGAHTAFVQAGMRRAAPATFTFMPRVQAGDTLAAGAILGEAQGATGRAQAVLAPPDVAGVVTHVVPAGGYREDETVCTVRTDDGGDARARDAARLAGARPAPRPAAAADRRAARDRAADRRLPVPGRARAARRRCPAASAPARRCCSKRWPRAAAPT